MHGYGGTTAANAEWLGKPQSRLALPAIPAPVALCAIIVAALGLRLALTLSHDGYLGTDGGAMLLSALHWMGQAVPAIDISRPPLSPGLLLAPFVAVGGLDTGYKVWTALASIFPVVAVIPLLRRFLSTWQTVAAVGLLAVDLTWAEMTFTGALPLVGFGLFALLLWALVKLVDGWSWPAALATLATVPLLAFTSQTATGIAAICVAAFVAYLWITKGLDAIDAVIAPLIVGSVLALTAWPWYAFPGSDKTLAYPGPAIYLLSGFGLVWYQMALLAGLSVTALRKAEQPALKAIAVMSLVLVALMPWASYDESLMNIFYRARFLAPIPTMLLGTWAFARYVAPAWKPLAVTGVAALGLLVALVGWRWEFAGQSRVGDMVTPDVRPMVEYVKANPNGAVITNTFSLGLWTSALTGEHTYWTWQTQPPSRYQETDAAVRCVLGWLTCDPDAARASLNVGYVLVDARHQLPAHVGPAKQPLYGAPAVNPWTESLPNAELVMQQGTAQLWRIP